MKRYQSWWYKTPEPLFPLAVLFSHVESSLSGNGSISLKVFERFVLADRIAYADLFWYVRLFYRTFSGKVDVMFGLKSSDQQRSSSVEFFSGERMVHGEFGLVIFFLFIAWEVYKLLLWFEMIWFLLSQVVQHSFFVFGLALAMYISMNVCLIIESG